jgi:hypothetical protein
VGLLIALLIVVLLARSGLLSSTGPALNGVTSKSRGTPTLAASSPAPTSTTAGGLVVSPSQVQLGCHHGQQTQVVVLANTGATDISWQAEFSGAADQAGVSLSPNHGDLHAGTSVAIQVQNQSQSGGQQGVIRFVPASATAGAPPSLSYTTMGCGG